MDPRWILASAVSACRPESLKPARRSGQAAPWRAKALGGPRRPAGHVVRVRPVTVSRRHGRRVLRPAGPAGTAGSGARPATEGPGPASAPVGLAASGGQVVSARRAGNWFAPSPCFRRPDRDSCHAPAAVGRSPKTWRRPGPRWGWRRKLSRCRPWARWATDVAGPAVAAEVLQRHGPVQLCLADTEAGAGCRPRSGNPGPRTGPFGRSASASGVGQRRMAPRHSAVSPRFPRVPTAVAPARPARFRLEPPAPPGPARREVDRPSRSARQVPEGGTVRTAGRRLR